MHYVAIGKWKKIEGIVMPLKNKAVHKNDGTVNVRHFTFQVHIFLQQDLFVLAQKNNQGVLSYFIFRKENFSIARSKPKVDKTSISSVSILSAKINFTKPKIKDSLR